MNRRIEISAAQIPGAHDVKEIHLNILMSQGRA